jgi:hypothetical protein
MPETKNLKVHLLSVNPPTDQETDQLEGLMRLWNLSDRRHSIVDNPLEADLCMVCNVAGPCWFSGLRLHPLINANPGKCFVIHDGDIAMPLLHGIYTSAIKPMARFGRIRGGAYNLFPRSTRNPMVEACDGKAFMAPKAKIISFRGQNSSKVREGLFQLPAHPDMDIVNTTGKFTAFAEDRSGKAPFREDYFEGLLSSKFALCPRGVSPSSIRLFEAMRMGVAPVIVSNACLLPEGPDWKEFALLLDELQINDLPGLTRRHEKNYQEMGKKARVAYEKYFSDEVYFNYLVDQISGIKRSQIIPERLFWLMRNVQVKFFEKKEIPLRNWDC